MLPVQARRSAASGVPSGAKGAGDAGGNSRSVQMPGSASPEPGAPAGNGSNDTDTSAQANKYQCAAARAAFPGDADALEGEGSGSNPMGAGLLWIAGSRCCVSGGNSCDLHTQ